MYLPLLEKFDNRVDNPSVGLGKVILFFFIQRTSNSGNFSVIPAREVKRTESVDDVTVQTNALFAQGNHFWPVARDFEGVHREWKLHLLQHRQIARLRCCAGCIL